MSKKYQVFLSSTYNDLKQERKAATETILMADCIPAGMELFVATDEEQFSVIKKVIDLCDYYVLIIGDRYGTINTKSNLSYTEMEYEYAVSIKLPVLVLVKERKAVQEDTEETILLEKFIKRTTNERLVSFWSDINDLQIKLTRIMYKAKIEIERPGWMRGGKYDVGDLLEQLNSLRIKKDELEKLNKTYLERINSLMFTVSEEKIFKSILEFKYSYTINTPLPKKRFLSQQFERTIKSATKKVKWTDLYVSIASNCMDKNPKLESKQFELAFISCMKTNGTFNTSDIIKFRTSLIGLGLISYTYEKRDSYTIYSDYVELTEKGKNLVYKILNAELIV